eukprot:653593_1
MNVMTVAHVYYDLTEWECDTNSPLDGEFDPKNGSFQADALCRPLQQRQVQGGRLDYRRRVGDGAGEIREPAVRQQHWRVPQTIRSAPRHSVNSENKWQISIHAVPNQVPTANIIVFKVLSDVLDG